MEQTYQVLYTKSSTKKRKSYQDGQLLISSSCITLLDDQGKEVYKKKCYMPSISHGEEVVLGAYDVQVEGSAPVKTDVPIIGLQNSRTAALGYVTHTSKPKIPVIANGKSTVKATTSYAATIKPAISAGVVLKAFVSKKFAPSNSIPSLTNSEGQQVMSTTVKGMCVTSSTASSINLKSQCSGSSSSSSSSSFVSSGGGAATSSEIVLDTALIRLMRPHQIQAANFLIRRLLGEASLEDQEKENGEGRKMPDIIVASTSSVSTNQKKIAATKKKLAKTQNKEKEKKKKKRKSMIVDSDEERSDSGSDDFSLNDSDSDVDDRCFEQKPPGFIHEDPSLPPAVPLSSYTGAILADEVGHVPIL